MRLARLWSLVALTATARAAGGRFSASSWFAPCASSSFSSSGMEMESCMPSERGVAALVLTVVARGASDPMAWLSPGLQKAAAAPSWSELRRESLLSVLLVLLLVRNPVAVAVVAKLQAGGVWLGPFQYGAPVDVVAMNAGVERRCSLSRR